MNELALALSTLGLGGLLGAYAKAVLDKRQLKFSKVFDYKERRYQAITIMMWVSINPGARELAMLKQHRPELEDPDELDKELELEYYNMMTYASDRVLSAFRLFLDEKNRDTWQGVARAMKKDLYL